MDRNNDPSKSPPSQVCSDLQADCACTFAPSAVSGGNKVREIICQNKTKQNHKTPQKTTKKQNKKPGSICSTHMPRAVGERDKGDANQ